MLTEAPQLRALSFTSQEKGWKFWFRLSNLGASKKNIREKRSPWLRGARSGVCPELGLLGGSACSDPGTLPLIAQFLAAAKLPLSAKRTSRGGFLGISPGLLPSCTTLVTDGRPADTSAPGPAASFRAAARRGGASPHFRRAVRAARGGRRHADEGPVPRAADAAVPQPRRCHFQELREGYDRELQHGGGTERGGEVSAGRAAGVPRRSVAVRLVPCCSSFSSP